MPLGLESPDEFEHEKTKDDKIAMAASFMYERIDPPMPNGDCNSYFGNKNEIAGFTIEDCTIYKAVDEVIRLLI